MSVPFIPTKNATAGVTTAPTTSNLTTAGQMAINAYTGTMYMRKEDSTISDIVGDRLSGFRNRIINGNMAIDQRNAGASITPTVNGAFPIDRFSISQTQASKFTFGQNLGSVTPQPGFSKYLGASVASAYSVTSSDFFLINQAVEGFNISDFNWGTSSASPIVISFYVKSSVTGTFGGAIENSAGNRCYVFSYTVSTTGWEQKSILIPGDTTGTWATDNSAGLILRFSLGAGTTYTGAAGSWGATRYFAPTGGVNLVGTASATFLLTGLQIEKGLVPTPFEVRSYGTELALCQRYWWRYSGNTIVGQTQAVGGLAASSTSASFPVSFQEMRATPSMTLNSTIIDANYVNVQATTGKWTLLLDGVAYASKTSGTFTVAAAASSVSSAYINVFGGALSGNVGTLVCIPTSGYLLTANAEL